MSGQIFISYRREESRWAARSLRDRLSRNFDPQQIFMDLDSIKLGENFMEVIESSVAKCDVLLAVIGTNWLTSKDDHGVRRLENAEDFVRKEIATALKREICVIPVLVDGARLPESADLPDDLKPLVWRNALALTDTTFDADCQRLAVAVKLVLEKAAAEEQEREKIYRAAQPIFPGTVERGTFVGTKDELKPEKALICFYRPKSFFSKFVGLNIREGPNQIAELPNGSYFMHEASPGRHTFTTQCTNFAGKTPVTKSATLDVQPEKVYYLKGDYRTNLIWGFFELRVVSEQQATADIRGLERLTFS
jgi:TIR domain/Protein of unknown function (DUF2846)